MASFALQLNPVKWLEVVEVQSTTLNTLEKQVEYAAIGALLMQIPGAVSAINDKPSAFLRCLWFCSFAAHSFITLILRNVHYQTRINSKRVVSATLAAVNAVFALFYGVSVLGLSPIFVYGSRRLEPFVYLRCLTLYPAVFQIISDVITNEYDMRMYFGLI